MHGETTDDGHADRFWALALATAAAACASGPIEGVALPDRESFGFEADARRDRIDHDLGLVRLESADIGGFE